jgi:Amt family ammonium transporter
MNLVPGLSLRATEDEEINGMDDAQLGEFAYDYVELRRETSDVIPGDIEAAAGSSKGSVAEAGEPTLAAEKV